MADCEICGRESQLYLVEIDRARLRVCFDCSKSGRLLEAPKPQLKKKVHEEGFQSGPARVKTEMDLVSDYGSKIKQAREKMHITRDVLAEMINEKESFLDRVEAEKTMPTEALGRKLEKALKISLYEEVGTGSSATQKGEKKGLTLGDVIKVRRKGEKNDEED
ncbi:MAG: multiprotein bridging factor aMBF1 [Candidatus Micrarchaeota archaeon]